MKNPLQNRTLLAVFAATTLLAAPASAQPSPGPPQPVGAPLPGAPTPLPANRKPLIQGPAIGVLRSGHVTMNYENIDLKVLARIMAELTGRNVVLDESVQGRVTVLSAREVSPDEAWEIFKSALTRAGFGIRQRGGFSQVVPLADVRREGPIVRHPQSYVADQELAILIMKEGDATQVQAAIRPFLSDPNNLQVYGPGRALILQDRAEVVHRIAELIHHLDKSLTPANIQVYFPSYLEAEKLAPVLQNVMVRNGLIPGEQPVKIIAFPPTNSLLVQGTKAQQKEFAETLARLDIPRAAPLTIQKPRYFVYRLQNGKAEDVAKILSQMLAERKALLAQEQQQNPARIQNRVDQAPPPNGANGTQQPNVAVTTGDSETADINGTSHLPFVSAKVSSDPETNAVVIYVSPTEYAPIRSLIAALDRRRRQVLVHAVVAEVSLSRLLDVGTRFQGLTPGGLVGVLNGGLTQQGLLSVLAAGQFVLGASSAATRTISVQGQDVQVPSFFSFVTANKQNNDFNLLSSPRLLTADHKKATIKVGNVVPFATGARFSQIGQPIVTYDYKDVGVKLEFTPHMSQSNSIRLELVQEVQEVTDYLNQTLGGFGYVIPLISNRRIQTDVTLKDGETLIIGGLISKRTTETIQKVPILGELPLIGPLFQQTHKEDTKTTLFISLTPYVIDQPEDVARIDQAYEMFAKGEGLPSQDSSEVRKTADSRHEVASPYGPESANQGLPDIQLGELVVANPEGSDALRQPRVMVTNGRGSVEFYLRGLVHRPDGKIDEFRTEKLRFNSGQSREITLPPYNFPRDSGSYEFDLQAVVQDRVVARLPVPKRVNLGQQQ